LDNKRVYRKKVFAPKEALEIIKEGKGTHFDPKLVEIFIKNESIVLQLSNSKKISSSDNRKYKIG